MATLQNSIKKKPQFQPLAQTFQIPTLNSPTIEPDIANFQGGAFLTSVDIFFFGKDELLPVFVEVRETINGYPGPKVLPFSRKWLKPESVNTSTLGDVSTTFTFSSPVYILEGVEYAMIVGSNSPDYKIFLARLGEASLLGGKILDKQPLVGTLFKSTNNTSWAISEMEDLKLKIKAAKFDISASGSLILNNDTIASKTLKENPLTFTHGDTALKVIHKDHGMYTTTNNVTITGAESGLSTTLASAISDDATSLTLSDATNWGNTAGKWAGTADSTSRWWIKIDDEIMYFTTISTTAVSDLIRAQNNTTAASHSAGATIEFYQLHKVPLTEVNATHTTLGNLDIDSYSVTLTTSPAFDGGSGAEGENGGIIVTATENHIICTGFPSVGLLELPNTFVTSTVQPTTATSISGSETSFSRTTGADAIDISLNDNYSFDVPFMIASSINETNEIGGNKSYTSTITLNSIKNNLSPVIDLKRCSWISIANRINDIDSSSDLASNLTFVDSTEPEGDNNAAIYITKKVVLENPATAIKVLLSAHRPSTSEIKLMYRILGTEDSVDFDDINYAYFNTDGSPDTTVNPSLDQDDFQEYVYSAGVTDDGIGTPLEEFISFSIKIILQGTNMAAPPRLSDFRALALAL